MIQIKKKKNVTEINSLISVQLKSEDRLIEIRLFTLQLKAWVEQWDLNLLNSGIFIDDSKNLLKTWRVHKNKTREKGKGMCLWDRVNYIWRMKTAWRGEVRSSQKKVNNHIALCGKKKIVQIN